MARTSTLFRSSSRRGQTLVVALIGLASDPAAAQQGPQSTAVAIAASFRAQGLATQLQPVAAVSGAMSRTYDSTQTVPSVSESLAIAPGDPTPTLFVSGEGLTSHTSSVLNTARSRTSLGGSMLANARLILTGDQPPSGAIGATTPALLIATRELVSSANFNTGATTHSLAIGLMSVGRLSISGHLVGDRVLRYSGSVAQNTVIFRSPELTITLNRQFESGTTACDDDCVEAPLSNGVGAIRIVAIDVQLHDAIVGRSKVSGEIRVNQATAQ